MRSGKLRVAFNSQNVALIQYNNQSGALTGVGADMATELGRAMRVRPSDIGYAGTLALFDAGRRFPPLPLDADAVLGQNGSNAVTASRDAVAVALSAA